MPSERALSAANDEADLVEGLRRGDERAFADLMATHNAALLHVAMTYVSSRAVADDVVQETWLGVVRGLDRFEGRSSLRTWIFRILVNRARTRAVGDARSIPFSALEDDDRPVVEPAAFAADGRWTSAPPRLETDPESSLARG